MQASRSDLQPALKEGGRDSRVSTGWLRHALVVSEIAASVVLVAAAMLLARSVTHLLDVQAGFNPSHVLTLRTSLPPSRDADGGSMARAYREIGQRLRDLPGVQSAGAVTGLPLASTRGDWGIRVEGMPMQRNHQFAADWQVITPGYFEAIGTPVTAGRLLTDGDRQDTLPVIVINETMAKECWPGVNPIGRRTTMGGNDNWLTVVGIVADVRHRGLDARPRAEMYRPHTQFRFGTGAQAAATAYARRAIQQVDPDLGVSDVATMQQVVADSTSDRRLNLLLFALLGGLALALATVGVSGVVAHSVTQRTHEIGVRMAIGARPGDVRRMVLTQGCTLAVLGVAIAAVASYIPARRATRVDPMVALRGD